MLGPGDPRYEDHRKVFNAAIDRRPGAVALCGSRDDVTDAVQLATERGFPVAVRCGATSEYATLDDGVLIDVSAIKTVEIDSSARRARVGAGLTWAEMDAATQEHGLAVTGARLSDLGVAGVTLCDGSGWLERSLGPTCLSLIAAEVVLADGDVVEASPERNPELLWALRGGGGGLGVVTELEFRLHPVGPTLLSGFLTFPRERAQEVARFYRDYMEAAADEVGGGLVLGAGLGSACTILFCHLGTVEEGERAVAPLRELGPSMDAVAPNEYRSFQVVRDLQNPFGVRAHRRGRFLRELSDEALEVTIAAAERPAATLSHVLLQPLGGAMGRVGRDEIALNLPQSPWAYRCLGLWPPVESLDPGNVQWVNGFAEAIEPFALDATFPSLLSAEGDSDRPAAAYSEGGLRRLREAKARYDPGDVFGRNTPAPVR